MESFIKYGIGAVAVVALVLGFLGYTRQIPVPVGAVSGSDFYNQVTERAGEVNETQYATSSQGTTITIGANEFTGWTNSGVVSYSPGLTAVTLTLPASSTIHGVVPYAGDRESFCVDNATSTANTVVTFAGGVGTKLIVASSSVSALGGKTLATGKVGCFTLIREAATSTAFDIDALLTVYQ